MASILVLLATGRGIQLANRLHDEGHIVKTWGCRDWKGRIGNYMKLVEQYDLVLCDGCGLDLEADELFQAKRIVIGGGSPHNKLANDMDYIHEVVDVLLPELTLEKFDGVSLSIQGCFGQGRWFTLPYYAIRYERLMDGEKGPYNGGMGNVVWLGSYEDRIFKSTLGGLEGFLSKLEYIGPFGIDVIIKEDKIRFKQFIPSFDFDTFQTWMELVRLPMFDCLFNVASRGGEIPYHLNQYSIGVRLKVEEYQEGLIEVVDAAKSHVWLEEGVNLGCVTARGSDIRESRRRVHRTIGNIVKSPEVMYRNDIGKDADSKIYQIKDWGWL